MEVEFCKINNVEEMNALITDEDWDRFFLTVATVMAIKSTCIRRRYGIIIVKDREIVGHGFNGNYDGEHRDCCKEGTCLRDEAGLDDDAYLEPCLREEFAISDTDDNFDGCTMYFTCYDKRNMKYLPVSVSIDWIYKLAKMGLSKIIFGIPKTNEN